MGVKTEELTMVELKHYISHLERTLAYYNKAEIQGLTTEDFKKAVASIN
jgi:hypothetical protein